MIQYLIVILIVAAAAIVVTRKLIYQTKGHGCQGCNCSNQNARAQKIVKTRQQ